MKYCLIPFPFLYFRCCIPWKRCFQGLKNRNIQKKWVKNRKFYSQQVYLSLFRFIDFQNNSFIVTFLYSIITIWKRFLNTRLTSTRGVLMIMVKISTKANNWKYQFASKKFYLLKNFHVQRLSCIIGCRGDNCYLWDHKAIFSKIY